MEIWLLQNQAVCKWNGSNRRALQIFPERRDNTLISL